MIVDPIYYANTYIGEAVPATVFPRYSAAAERAILLICGNPCVCNLPDCQQEAIRTAICAQIEYYITNGISVANTGITGQDYTIGKIRVGNGGQNSVAKKGAATMICPAAVAALEQTGLLNRSVPVAGDPMYTGFGWLR